MLGLGHWTIGVTEGVGGGGQSADVECWAGVEQAEITIYPLAFAEDASGDPRWTLERVVIHELVHVLQSEMEAGDEPVVDRLARLLAAHLPRL